MEIERKYLIKEMPDLSKYEKSEIIQAYLSVRPVIRIRKEDDTYYLTYKNGGGMAHEEANLPLDRVSFEHLLPKHDGKIISKTRYRIPIHDGLTVELDIFHGDHEGLQFLEVEFASVEQARNFKEPDWFGEEVTHDVRYHNSHLI